MQSFLRRFLFVFVFYVIAGICCAQVVAQPPVNQQIIKENLPVQIDPRIFTPAQINAMKSDNNRNEQGADKNETIQNKKKQETEDSLKKESPKNITDPSERTYGDDVFVSAAVTDISELSTPPLDYPIGVGDHIVIALWGGAEFQQDYVVGKDGAIFPQGIGKIFVQGLTYENMRGIVSSRFKKSVPGGTKISVTLGQPRTININVVGNVNKPGPLTVSAFSNAFNVIAKAGGLTQYGNLRSIQIKRGGKLIDELDVYKYLTTGEFGKQIYLDNNDYVIVGFAEKTVLASGPFKRPMYYQLKNSEGLKALLTFTGGLRPDAYASAVKVSRIENQKQLQKDYNADSLLSASAEFLLKDGDVVKVETIRKGIINRIELQGEINYPGVYELRPGEKLFDVIKRAGGVTNNTYLKRAYVFRGAAEENNFNAERMELNLEGLNKNDDRDSFNLELMPYDVVQFFANSDFNQQQYVEIFGEVRKPGKVKKYGKLTLQDVLLISGGLKPSAEFGRLEISSIVDADSAQKGMKPTRTEMRSYAIQQDLILDKEASNVILKPYDQIYVRKNPDFELQQNIEIKGLVKYPGQYPRLDKYERLSSYIDRAGGITQNADVSGAVLMRRRQTDIRDLGLPVKNMKTDSLGNPIKDSVPLELRYKDEPVSIELYKALKKRNSKYDIILQENDVVFVPEINPFVSVVGNVQSPLKVAFDQQHKKATYYIDKAGGYGVKPWRKRVFVTYANGRSRRTRNFGFLHFYPRVRQGAVVTVPVRPEGQGLTDLVKSTFVAAIPVVLSAIIFKYIK